MEKQVRLYEFRLKLTQGQLRNFLTLGFLCFFAGDLSPESITLSTYYPAPAGVYNNLLTTGNTWLARDNGQVIVGGNDPAGVRLGIGTNSPQAAVDVNGVVRVGNYNNPPSPVTGGIYFNSSSAQYMGSTNGTSWGPISGGGELQGVWSQGTNGAPTDGLVTSGEPFTWTNPGGVTKIVYEIYGGGGGACHSAGGGSGAACMGVLNVAGVHSISGYLGGGGWGGACNSLGFGQASMFSFPGGGSCYAGGGTMGTGGMAAWAYGGQINIPGGTTNSITGAGNMRAPSTGDGQGSACGGGGGHSSPWGDAGGAGCVIFWEY